MIKGNLATIGQSFTEQINNFKGIDFVRMAWTTSQSSTHDASDPSAYEQVEFEANASLQYSGLYNPNEDLTKPLLTIKNADLSLLLLTFIWNLPSDTIATGKTDAYMLVKQYNKDNTSSNLYRFHETGISDASLHSECIVVPFVNMSDTKIAFEKQKGITISNLNLTCLSFKYPLN